ncbi:MAG: VTT domain-containing protein [Candidatus Nanohaloarchaea archaeon]
MVLGFTQEVLLQMIRENGVLAVVLGMVIEEVIVPVPSPVVPMAAGFILVEAEALLPAGVQIFMLIALPASIASVLSSYFVYGIAYFGGKPILQKYGHLLDLRWEEAREMEEHFTSGEEHLYVALFRAIPIVPLSLISGSAGLFRMEWKQYGVWSFIGMLPRNFFLALLGWYVKEDILWFASQVDHLSTAVVVLTAGAVGSFIAYRKLKDLHRYLIRYSA